MKDICDKADEWATAALQDEIQDARKHLSSTPSATGFCLYCEEPLNEGVRFCDKDCAEDAERMGTYDGRFIPVDKNRRISQGTRPQYLTKTTSGG